MLIKSLKNNNSYKIPIIHKVIDNLQVKFFKEKNQLILIDYRALYFWKFNNNIQTFQFFSKLSIEEIFVFNILNRKTFIINTNDCLLLYDANTLNIKKKIYYDDEEEIDEKNINNEDEVEEEYEDIGTEGNYLNEKSEKYSIAASISCDKKYLVISNMEGWLLVYNIKNFKKEKIKKFENYSFTFLRSYSYDNIELEKINTIKINNIKPVSNFFILVIDYAIRKTNQIKYKRGLIPLKKIGKIWKFAFFVENPFSVAI